MSANKLLEALAAYQQLSDREQELFYQVVYRTESEESDNCSEVPEYDYVDPISPDLKKSLDSIKNIPINWDDLLEKAKKAKKHDSIVNPNIYPNHKDYWTTKDGTMTVSTNPNGIIVGYGINNANVSR